VFVGLALLYGDIQELGWPTAVILTAVTFLALFWVAAREVRKRRRAKEARTAAAPPPPPPAPPSEPVLQGALSSGVREEGPMAEAQHSS
jgi:hypothetical protein